MRTQHGSMPMRQPPPERLALLLLLATFLFAGALRAFLSAVYYQNLATLELNATALYALLLLAPLLFFAPTLARRPAALLVGAALALAVGRFALAFTRGTPVHLPLAGVSAAAWLVLLGALLPSLRDAGHAGAGIALGWALDAALLWMGDSSDLTAGPRGLMLVVPAGLLLLLVATQATARPEPREDARERAPWLAGAALGAWLFLVFTLAANPYGAARWNGHEPERTAIASVAGLAVGALLARRAWKPAALWVMHAGALAALLDHAFLHTALFPLLLAILAATLALDAALLLRALARPGGGRALVATGAVALALHFLYAFTFLFEYVPLGALWEGNAPWIYLAAGALLVAPLARAPAWEAERGRALASLAVAPALVALVALATPGAQVLEPPDDDGLRILSFNVHQGFANDGVLDPDVFVAAIESARIDDRAPDVIVLQESDTPRFTSGNLDIATYLSERLGYHLAYGQPTSAQAFGGAILSRHPIAEWTYHELPSASDDRSFTEARLDVGGTDVWVYAVHLGLPREDRVAQTDALLARAATRAGPVVLAGDFNSCPSGLCPEYEEGVADDVYARITARYQDAWAAAGGAVDDPAAYTFDSTAPYERIDYVFASPDVQVVDARTVTTDAALRASDHLPVFALLRVA